MRFRAQTEAPLKLEVQDPWSGVVDEFRLEGVEFVAIVWKIDNGKVGGCSNHDEEQDPGAEPM